MNENEKNQRNKAFKFKKEKETKKEYIISEMNKNFLKLPAMLEELDILDSIDSISLKEINFDKLLDKVLEEHSHVLQNWIQSLGKAGEIPLYLWLSNDPSGCPVKPPAIEYAETEHNKNVSNVFQSFLNNYDRPFLARLAIPPEVSELSSTDIFVCTPVKWKNKVAGLVGIPFPENSNNLYPYISTLVALSVSFYLKTVVMNRILDENINKMRALRNKSIQTQENGMLKDTLAFLRYSIGVLSKINQITSVIWDKPEEYLKHYTAEYYLIDL